MGGKSNLLLIIILLLLLTTFNCNGDDDDSGGSAQSDDDDDDSEDSGTIVQTLPAYLIDRPYLADWSLWQSRSEADNPAPLRQLGGFAVGNGRVFSMVAGNTPFTTMHNIAGPYYQKRNRFFSDKSLSLYQAGRQLVWESQRAMRIRETSVILTQSKAEGISLWTVDIAPRGGVTDENTQNTIIRTIIIHNRSDEPVTDLKLTAGTTLGFTKNGLITESIYSAGRHLAGGFVAEEQVATHSEKEIALFVPVIEPDGEYICRFLLAFSKESGDAAVTAFRKAEKEDVDALLKQTVEAWKEMTARGARISTPNKRMNDLLEGLAQTMAVQQAQGGCFAQMSEYGYNALRDMYGIARFYPLIGRNEEYKGMLDYVWQAALKNGNINADVQIDLEFDPDQPEPEWDSLPTLTGRTKAESPSYLILMYREYLNATGDWSILEDRYKMLRHALVHQDMRHDCLLPFSDDETFRIAMMAAFGHSLFEGYVDKFLSANSSFLYVVAAEFMQTLALHMGLNDDAIQYGQLAKEVRDCAEQYYWMPGGYYSPIIDIDSLEPDERIFEDVNTKPLWLGYLDPGDDNAQSNVLAMMDMLRNKEGFFHSPLAEIYDILGLLLGATEGIATGMAPGFQLDNLARIDHPAAEEAFYLQEKFFQDSGNVSEAHALDDFGRVVYFHEPFGFLCDLTARFRSWEGSINAAAIIQYLFGLELDAANGRIKIAPHLPGDWPESKMTGARLGDARFDIVVTDDGSTRTILVENATGSFKVDARISIKGDIKKIEINDTGVNFTPEVLWGRTRVMLTDMDVTQNSPLEIILYR